MQAPSLLPVTPFSSSPRRLCTAVSAVAQQQSQPPWMTHAEGIRVPTAPWMTSPLIVPADDVLDLSKPPKPKTKMPDSDDYLTGRVKGGRSRLNMRRVVDGVAKLREIDPSPEEVKGRKEEEKEEEEEPVISVLSMKGEEGDRKGEAPWAMRVERAAVFRRMKKENVVTAAEVNLPREDLIRLRDDARKIRRWINAKKAGVTEEVVDEIRRTWSTSELATVKFVQPLSRNMDRAREIIEIKTEGFVVWCKKDIVVIYRGQNYEQNSMSPSASGKDPASEVIGNIGDMDSTSLSNYVNKAGGIVPSDEEVQQSIVSSIFFEASEDTKSISGSLYERETNRLLDGLGPRFVDWWWSTPLPVDADLLPEVIPGFKLPHRRCLPNVKLKLTDNELTYLRKIARPLPTHFALGENSKLQGLAASVIKLWEKSSIAKIAIKRGIPNTSSELMSSALKRLTGGILILRNKFFIILYRGKDFLPERVATSVVAREKELESLQTHEEQARGKAVQLFYGRDCMKCSTDAIGTCVEFQDIQTKYKTLGKENINVKVELDAEKENLEKGLKNQENQLSRLKLKIERSEKELAKLNSKRRRSGQATDQELLTEEERRSLQKIGLKMDEVLSLGRRGIYDGIIGSLHLHWKHKELVKIVTMQHAFSHVMYTAECLETESGGILISVEKLKNGHAIIIYRGKNYEPPLKIFPNNLLTKREALERSIEVQRRGSLKFFAVQKEQSIEELKCRLENLEKRAKNLIDEGL